MSKKITVKVEFCGSSLEGVVIDGRAYVAMKPIVEGIGLDWAGQFSKIKSDDVLGQVIEEIPTTSIGADGKKYKTNMLCLPEEYLQGWMFTIKSGKVKSSLREKIVTYKRECYKVLHNAFTNGVADTNMRVMAIDSKRAAGRLMTDVTKDVLLLTGKTLKPYHFSNEHRLVNWALTGDFGGLKEDELPVDQLKLLADLRRRNTVLIGMGMSYDIRKKALEVFTAEKRYEEMAKIAA